MTPRSAAAVSGSDCRSRWISRPRSRASALSRSRRGARRTGTPPPLAPADAGGGAAGRAPRRAARPGPAAGLVAGCDALRVGARRDGRGAGRAQGAAVGLEPVGAVHSRDTDLVAARLGVALDLGLGGIEPMEETLERG